MSPIPPRIPGYWRNETSGTLAPVVEKYLRGERLNLGEVKTMRAYLRQWINADFRGPAVQELRERVDSLTYDADVRAWLRDASEFGCDPL
jgi:hypothetical protein